MPAGCPSNACTVLVPPSHYFANQHSEKQVALTLDKGPASDMMNGNTLEIVRPRWLKRQLTEVVAKLNKMDDQATSRVFPGTEAATFPESLGFRSGSMSVHTSRTMMLEELGLVLDRVSQIARKGEYELAIVEQNILGKPTRTTRQRTVRRLTELYALDPSCPIFRMLRRYWSVDTAGRPMLAFLTAAARDPLLRDMTPYVLSVPAGETVGSEQVGSQLAEKYPARFQATTNRSTAQNLASSWTQAGFLRGKIHKTRVRPQVTPVVLTLRDRSRTSLRPAWEALAPVAMGPAAGSGARGYPGTGPRGVPPGLAQLQGGG